MGFSVLNNTPVAGAIQWADMSIQYMGETYAIENGYTNTRYTYWTPQYPFNLVISNDFPTLGPDDCLVFVNKSGLAVTVPNASVVDGDIIVPGTILTNALAANVITSDKIAAGAVTADSLAAGAVTANSIAAGSVSAEAIAANAIGAQAIAADSITSDVIVAGAITTAHIAAQAVTANEIAANAILAGHIKAGEIDANHIKAGVIQTNHLAPEFGDQLVISANPAIDELTDAVAGEKARAEGVENELKEFTDKANAFFIFDMVTGTLTIGKADSPFTQETSPTQMSFLQGGDEVAFISNNKLYITVAHVKDILSIGDKAVSEGGDGFVDMDTKEGGLRASWRAS